MARSRSPHLPPSERAKRGKKRQKLRRSEEIDGKTAKQVRSNERADLRQEYLTTLRDMPRAIRHG